MTVGCEACGRKFVVKDALEGGGVKCLYCGAAVPAVAAQVTGDSRPVSAPPPWRNPKIRGLRRSGLARAAFAFSLMTLVGGFVAGTTLLAWIVGGATAWTLGRDALRRIEQSDERLLGAGYARAAVILGGIQCVGSIALIVGLFLYLRFGMAALGEARESMK